MSKCCVLPRTASELPPQKVQWHNPAHISVTRDNHTFPPQHFHPFCLYCLGWAGRGGVRGGYHALCFMTSGQAGHRPAPPSHFISIPRVIIYTTESLSILSTLYLQSYYLHYLFADFQSRMTRWWWPRHSSAVCTNEIAIFLITVQLRCKHRVQDSRNNTRYPEISIIHSQ